MRKMYSFIIILMLMLSMSGCIKSKKEEKLDYSSIQHIDIESIYQYNKSEVYFYTEECPYCNNLKENILNYAQSQKKIVFFKVSHSDRLDIEKLYNTNFLGVPAILVFKDNQIIESYYGFSTVSEYINNKT